MPKRIQRKRTLGWKMPPDTIYVGRPSVWGNPFKVTNIPRYGLCVVITQNHVTRILDSHCVSQDEAVKIAISRYESYAATFNLESLRGRDLACWCPLDQPCHADVLLRMANQWKEKGAK